MKAWKIGLVGFLFFSSIAVVGYFTIITESGPLRKKGFTATILFPTADGIKLGNKVTVQGVPYGYVSSIRLVSLDINGEIVPDGTQGLYTQVEIGVNLKGPLTIYENYRVEIRNESLLSGRVISIDPGSRIQIEDDAITAAGNGSLLSDPATSKNVAFTSLATPQKETPALPNNAKLKGKVTQDPLVQLSELIAENRNDIRKTVSNIREITRKVNSGQGTLGKLINQNEAYSNVNTVLTDAQVVLRELREGLEDLREQAPVTSFLRSALSAF